MGVHPTCLSTPLVTLACFKVDYHRKKQVSKDVPHAQNISTHAGVCGRSRVDNGHLYKVLAIIGP